MPSETNYDSQLVISSRGSNANEQFESLLLPPQEEAAEQPKNNRNEEQALSRPQSAVSLAREARSPPLRSAVDRPKRVISPTVQIFMLVGVISLPFIVLSTVLLVIVFTHRLLPSTSILAQETAEQESGVYFINFDATRLLVASLSSSAAPILTAFFMNLLSYPLSSRFISLFRRPKIRKSSNISAARPVDSYFKWRCWSILGVDKVCAIRKEEKANT